MGVDEGDLQVMDVEMIKENFPIYTYGTYIPTTSKKYSIETHLDLLRIPQSGMLIHTSAHCLKKNLNASRPSEHPPVRWKNVKTFRWNHRLQIQNLFMAFKRVPRW